MYLYSFSFVYTIGYIHNEGSGVDKDIHEAIRLYKLSADQGNKNAYNNLKVSYNSNINIIIGTLLTYNKENKELKEEVEKLRFMAPLEGGQEYQKAKNEFDKKVESLMNYGSLNANDHK